MLAYATQRPVSAGEAISVVLRVALEHHQQGQLREAAALYREVRGIDPDNADAVFLLGLIALSVKNYAAAELLLTLAARQMPDAPHAHKALGDALVRRGRAGQALASYWRALALDPQNASAYVDLGETLVAMKSNGGNRDRATACFARALLLDASCTAAYAGLGCGRVDFERKPVSLAGKRAGERSPGRPVRPRAWPVQ